MTKFLNRIRSKLFNEPITDETKWKHEAFIKYDDNMYIHILIDQEDPSNYSVSWITYVPDWVDARETKLVVDNLPSNKR